MNLPAVLFFVAPSNTKSLEHGVFFGRGEEVGGVSSLSFMAVLS